MKDTLTMEQAVRRLLEDGNASWTYRGARALVEYLMQYEEDTGDELEFDPVAFRGEFSEYASLEEAAEDYGIDDAEELREQTDIIEFSGGRFITDSSGGVIVRAF